MRSIGVGAVIGALFFSAAGLFALGVGARNVYRAVASKSWRTAPGVVVESQTEKSASRDGRRTSVTYGTTTVVRFQANGNDFETSTRQFGQIVSSGDITEAVLDRYRHPVGKQIPVSYNASNPAIATVHTGMHRNALLLPVAGVAFLGMAFLVFVMGKGSGGTGTIIKFMGFSFCGIGLTLLTPGAINLWFATASTTWPTTQALVVYGTPRTGTPTAEADSTNAAPQPTSDSLEVSTTPERIVYRYEVAGQPHYGNTRRFGQLANSSEADWSASISQRYPLGQIAKVSYSPSDADVSVLEPGVATEAWFLPGAGLAFLLFGLAALKWAVPALSR